MMAAGSAMLHYSKTVDRSHVKIQRVSKTSGWNNQMISVREGKAIPRPDGIEWRNKFICIEEPFDRTNTARAVHEKQKFDVIIDEFQKSWQRLRDRKDLNCILPVRGIIQKR